MISKNLKPIFLSIALASFTLMATDGNDSILLPYDDTPPPPSNSPTLQNTDEAFENLIIKLRTLSPIKKKTVSWKNAIAEFQASLSSDSEFSSLDQIKERILKENLGEPREKMVEKAINGLKFDSQSALLTALVPAAKTSSPPKMFTPSLPPIGLIMIPVSNTVSRKRPILSSERKGSRFKALSEDFNTSIVRSPVGTKTLSPHVIKEHLKKYIAAQDEPIGMLSTLAHRFLCNKALIERGEAVSCASLHCILTGPTGCGKSETLKKLIEFLRVPILYVNARSLTDEGFKGQNFSECVAKFCEEHRDTRSVIVALEELDKLGISAGGNEQDTKSFGRSIQRILLTPLDGNPISIKDRQVPTPNWWFIGTGAFSAQKGVHDAKGDRTTTVRTSQDIVRAGFEPEFVGRFPSVIPFKGHTLETMIAVITKESSPVSKVKNEFKKSYGVDLNISQAALNELAAISIEMNLGVRSLNAILNLTLQSSYTKALELMTAPEEERSIIVEFRDVKPAIDQFKQDNRERDPREAIPEHLQHLYL